VEFHQLCKEFPLMKDDEFSALVEDIRKNGLIKPIILFEGQILDGQNRYLACKEANVEPYYQDYTGQVDPKSLVQSLNIHRRHLSESQRAMLGAKFATMRQGERTDLAPIGGRLSQSQVSDLLKVGERSVERASKVQRDGIPELQLAVDRGEMSVYRAAEIAKEGPEEQLRRMEVHYSSASYEWYTPTSIINGVLEVLTQIDLDPCSNSANEPVVPALNHFTKEDDGLDHEWCGKIYMNPPYGRQIALWTEYLIKEYKLGRVTEAIALLPARTDTEWFKMLREYPICFINGRLRFSNANNTAPFPSMLVYLGEDVSVFKKVFSSVGGIFKMIV